MLLGAADLLLAQLPMLLVVLVELPSHLPLAAFASAAAAAAAAFAANMLLSNTALRLLLLPHRHPRWLLMMTSSTSMIVETRWGIGSPLSLAVVGLVLAVGLLVALVAEVGLVEPLDLRQSWWSLGGKHCCMQSRSDLACSD